MPRDHVQSDGSIITELSQDDLATRCSFCAKEPKEVAKIIDGPLARICNECITLMYECILTQEQRKPGSG